MQASVSIVLVVQSLNCVQLFETPWTAVHQASPPFTISQNLLKFMSVESMMPFNHLIFYHSFLLLLSIFPSIRVFSSESALLIESIRASGSVLSRNIQSWIPLALTGLIPLLSNGLSRVFSSTIIQKHQFFSAHPSLWSNSHIRT